MPADDDYGRRQILQPQTPQQQPQQQQHASQSPLIANHCPAGCNPASTDGRQQERYASEKNLLEQSNNIVAANNGAIGEHQRFAADRFGSERSSSDRLPSGERYQGVSERYPLGERPQTSVSTDRLLAKEDRLLSKEALQTSNHCQNEKAVYQQERYSYERTNCQRFPERYTPVQNIGSLDRYHTHATLDRYSRTTTPTERYHSDKSSCNERYATMDKYSNSSSGPMETFNGAIVSDRHASAQNICSIERYTPTDRHRSCSKPDIYKIERSGCSSERKERERYQREQYQNRFEQYVNERFNQDRFPPIPCPERFATTQNRSEKMPFSQVSYLEPPSPAPANDRFIPPPPLSPDNTPSPDCFSNNTFPSPTATVPPPERFVPPPPLSPSPTETYANSPKQLDRYQVYSTSPNSSGDRYQQHHHHHHHQHQHSDHNNKYKDNRYQSYSERYQSSSTGSSHTNNYHSDNKYVNNDNRFNNGGTERYLPPNAHVPVERYVPQPQDIYYNNYNNQSQYGYKQQQQQFNASDPYMRRDLAFHYRLPLPNTYSGGGGNQFQRVRYVGTPSRMKCCQYQEAYQQLSKSSPGSSSSSSSVTSQGGKDLHQKEVAQPSCSSLQEMQCQNYQHHHHHHNYHHSQGGATASTTTTSSTTAKEYHCGYQQEKGVQCGNVQCQQQQGNNSKECVIGFVSPNLRVAVKSSGGQCRHSLSSSSCASPSVEYVGASGGRHVCATPPPRGSIGSGDGGSVCSDICCPRRVQNSLTVAIW